MGSTIWIEAQGPSAEETHEDLSILHALDKPLDLLAARLAVTKLTAFYDYQALNDEFDSEFDDEIEAGEDRQESEPSWFDSVDGLKTIHALHVALMKDFDALKWKPTKSREQYPQRLLEELEFCKGILEKAAKKQQKFRLLIVS